MYKSKDLFISIFRLSMQLFVFLISLSVSIHLPIFSFITYVGKNFVWHGLKLLVLAGVNVANNQIHLMAQLLFSPNQIIAILQPR